jgi:hypothetical protein
MRALWITLALTLAPGLTRADVVYSVTSAGSGASGSGASFSTNSGAADGTTGSYSNTIGQSFRNIGQSAFVNSVTFRLATSNLAGFSAGTLKVGIYAVSGTLGSKDFAPIGPALISSSTINASTLNNEPNVDYQFSGFGTSSSLNASTNYMALLTWSGINFSSSNLLVEFFNGIPASSTYENYNLALSGNANSTQQMYGTINVTAVPEPGTLLLGSIAAACGGGAWWRRKRHQASKATAQESVA